jgi:hypothetical protein
LIARAGDELGLPPVHSAWAIIRRGLEEELHRVCEEIRNYPAPIPACDAQFNYLLEEREALSSELLRARAQVSENSEPADTRQSVDAFLSSSKHLGDSVKRDIRALINNEHRRGEYEQ